MKFKKIQLKFLTAGALVLLIILLVFGFRRQSPLPDDKSFASLSAYFKREAEQKGGVFAYDLLRKAALPPQTDIHLLGHVVGDVLYKDKGARALADCTDEFRNACSHSVVVGLLMDKGEPVLQSLNTICEQSPGGKGAYPMCFHGLGHGVLAYANYDFDRAVNLCALTNTSDHQNVEGGECVGGAVMELISGGGHDRELWQVGREKFLQPDNPLALCLERELAPEARRFCLYYLTPFLVEAGGGDLWLPADKDWQTAFSFCEDERLEEGLKATCYGAFGKEFVVLAKNRDIRNIESMSREELLKVVNWCQLSGDKKGADVCFREAVNSLYWGGENSYQTAVDFCSLVPVEFSPACLNHLKGAVKFYTGADL